MADEKKGITVKIDANLHAEIREYLERHEGMTMAEFITPVSYTHLTVLAAKYSESHGFEFVTWKQNADGKGLLGVFIVRRVISPKHGITVCVLFPCDKDVYKRQPQYRA